MNVQQNLLRSCIPTVPLGHLVDLLNEMGINLSIDHILHHGQMLEVIMGLEKGVSGEEFHQDTSNAPDVTRE
jgi:hypothetical protein